MDTVVIFEDCLIPWDNIYIYQDVEMFHKQLQHMRFHDALGHHVRLGAMIESVLMMPFPSFCVTVTLP